MSVLTSWPTERPSRHNIRPTVPVGTIDAEGFQERRWSLIPPWSKTEKLKYATFNARAETLHEKPAYRHAWKQSQRCLIPASGYFEWTGEKGAKQCHYVTPSDGKGLVFAGLYESWKGEDQEIQSCTIVTTQAEPSISWLHHRMPQILEFQQIDTWLHGSPEEASMILQEIPAYPLTITQVASPKAVHEDA